MTGLNTSGAGPVRDEGHLAAADRHEAVSAEVASAASVTSSAEFFGADGRVWTGRLGIGSRPPH